MLKKRDTADLLLEAAEDELTANDGQMEMAGVAKRAGVSVGLAYHHFGSKAGLVAAVVDKFYGPLRAISLGTEIPLDLDWSARERARMEATVDYFYSNRLAPLISGRLAREPQVLDIERVHMQALLASGTQNIRQGQKHGVVDVTLDPKVTVSLLMGGLRLALDEAILAKQRPPRARLKKQIWQFTRQALWLPHHD